MTSISPDYLVHFLCLGDYSVSVFEDPDLQTSSIHSCLACTLHSFHAFLTLDRSPRWCQLFFLTQS